MQEDIAVIKQGIMNEIEGYEFYRMAALQASSEESKATFEQLAKEEFIHVEWLRELFDRLHQGKEDVKALAFKDTLPTPGIFNREHLTVNPSLSVAVFGIAIQMEKASVEFYRQAAARAYDPMVKRLYDVLARWEENHLQQFEEHYEGLKENWWNQQDFSPM